MDQLVLGFVFAAAEKIRTFQPGDTVFFNHLNYPSSKLVARLMVYRQNSRTQTLQDARAGFAQTLEKLYTLSSREVQGIAVSFSIEKALDVVEERTRQEREDRKRAEIERRQQEEQRRLENQQRHEQLQRQKQEKQKLEDDLQKAVNQALVGTVGQLLKKDQLLLTENMLQRRIIETQKRRMELTSNSDYLIDRTAKILELLQKAKDELHCKVIDS